jgi:hypothetical protein
MQPSPTLGGDRGTKAAEYSVDDVCQGHEALDLCLTGLPSGEAVDRRCFGSRLHDPKSGRGAFEGEQNPIASGARCV